MKYKAIRSTAHNLAAQFTSTLNWAGDDHTMSHLARLAASSGLTEFSIDLLTGHTGPEVFVTAPVVGAVRHFIRSLPDGLARQRVDIAHIASARLVIRFGLEGTVAAQGGPPPWTVPFECLVTLVDDRGKEHEGRVQDMWHVGEIESIAAQ